MRISTKTGNNLLTITVELVYKDKAFQWSEVTAIATLEPQQRALLDWNL